MEQKIVKKAKGNVKKSFYDVEAPMTSAKISLYGGSPEEFAGKVVKIDLTKNLRGKSIDLKMKVVCSEGKLSAVPLSTQIVGAYIRRVMRTGIDYVEDSFSADCKDAVVRIKPFLITRRKVSRELKNQLRVAAKKFLLDYVKIRGTREIFSDIISNKIQKTLAGKLKKIYPLAMCEIRLFEVEEMKAVGSGDEKGYLDESVPADDSKIELVEEEGEESLEEIEVENTAVSEE